MAVGVDEGGRPHAPRAVERPVEELDATAEDAFTAFTERIDEWWHPAYAPEGLERIGIDPEVGGRAWMRLADGTTYPWGTVTAWRPPREYAQTFTLAQDPEHPSTLRVRIESTSSRGRRHPAGPTPPPHRRAR